MTQYAQLPDGTYAEFPDEATPEQMAQALNSAQPQKSSGFDSLIDTLSRNVAQPFNRGLLAIPGMLPGGDSLKADARNLGLIEPEGQESEGFIPRSAEILGGATLPAGTIGGIGANVIKNTVPYIDDALKTMPFLKWLAAQTARNPKSTMASEVIASLGAGAGGEVAESAGVDPLIGEMTGGLGAATIPAATRAAGRGAGYLAGKAADVGEYIPGIGALIRGGRTVAEGVRGLGSPWYRAAKGAQGAVADPELAAADIDVNSPMPPLRQIGTERALELEGNLRARSSPEQAEKVAQDVTRAVGEQKATAIDVGGDTQAPRAIIRQQAQDIIDDANRALDAVDPGAKPWEISEDAMTRVQAAAKAAREVEAQAWNDVGMDSAGNYSNTAQAVENIRNSVGRSMQNRVIPPEVMVELEAAMADDAVTTLRDIRDLRSIVQGIKGSAILDPEKRGMVKWLSDIEDALLKDMESVSAEDAAALKKARQTTMDLYDNFRRGKMGEILGYSERNTAEVLPQDALRRVFTGSESARNVEQLIRSTPEAEQPARDYLKSTFYAAAVNENGSFNLNAANRFIRTLRERRIFEVFPELEDELIQATSKQNRAQTLADADEVLAGPQNALTRMEARKSLTQMFLEQPPEKEMRILLDRESIRDPVQAARKLITRMGGNEAAEEGLRQSFRESMWDYARRSQPDIEGNPVFDAGRFNQVVKENIDVMKALGFDKDNVENIQRLAAYLRQAQAEVPKGDAKATVIPDLAGYIMARVNQVLGARLGSGMDRLLGGGTAGTSLQSAQMGAASVKKLGEVLRFDPAERLLIDAMDDPALMKALLLRDSASEAAKKSAAAKLNAWAAGVGLTDDSESE